MLSMVKDHMVLDYRFHMSRPKKSKMWSDQLQSVEPRFNNESDAKKFLLYQSVSISQGGIVLYNFFGFYNPDMTNNEFYCNALLEINLTVLQNSIPNMCSY